MSKWKGIVFEEKVWKAVDCLTPREQMRFSSVNIESFVSNLRGLQLSKKFLDTALKKHQFQQQQQQQQIGHQILTSANQFA